VSDCCGMMIHDGRYIKQGEFVLASTARDLLAARDARIAELETELIRERGALPGPHGGTKNAEEYAEELRARVAELEDALRQISEFFDEVDRDPLDVVEMVRVSLNRQSINDGGALAPLIDRDADAALGKHVMGLEGELLPLEARDYCWHCKCKMVPVLHCEDCPPPGECDVDGCTADGCSDEKEGS